MPEEEMSRTYYFEGYLSKDIKKMPVMQPFQVETCTEDKLAGINANEVNKTSLAVIARWDPKSDYLTAHGLKSSKIPGYSSHYGLLTDRHFLHDVRLRRQFSIQQYYSHVPRQKTDGLVHYQLKLDVKGELGVAGSGDDFMLKQTEGVLKDFNVHPQAARHWLN